MKHVPTALIVLGLMSSRSIAQQSTAEKLADAKKLKGEAQQITKKIGRLASEGKLPTDDEGIKLLRQLVDQLADINNRLKALEGKEPTKAEVAGPKIKIWGYLQTQYQSTDRKGTTVPTNGFRSQDSRLNIDLDIDQDTKGRFSWDMSQGSNQATTQLRDAWFNRALTPRLSAQFGQQVLPVGYELSQLPFEREFADRAKYDQLQFPGERSRGLQFLNKVGRGWTIHAGLFDSLTINDPEQINASAGTGSRVSGVLAARFKDKQTSGGLGVILGQRGAYSVTTAGVTTTAPVTDHQYLVADINQERIFGSRDLTLRFEGFLGRDRVGADAPSTTSVDHPMLGFDSILSYELNKNHGFMIRWQQFDPNRDAAGDYFTGIGLAYMYRFSPLTRINLAHEIFSDSSRSGIAQTRYGLTTLRFQTRF